LQTASWERVSVNLNIEPMWIVALALRRPYTFTVFAILIMIAGLVAITRTPKDIFTSINIPVISVLWFR
jgi:multidrug efflux pump subunit AcrB